MPITAQYLATGKLGGALPSLDWIIIIIFLLGTTAVAVLTKGRQWNIRDFFLGNHDLPWLAVGLSLIATEISAASYIGVPLLAYHGSLVYLQLAIGAIIARFIIAYYFVPAFYEQETYSPYQFIGRKLGPNAERMTSLLFVLGAVIGQGARVFILAEILRLIAGIPVTSSVLLISIFGVLWGVIGGIRTSVWTGVVQFGVLLLGCLVAAIYLISQINGGLAHILEQNAAMGKLKLFDFEFDRTLEMTLWTGILGSTFNTLASHGVDQMNTQRLFCCRNSRDAKTAIIFSSFTQLVVLLMLFVGLGLYTFFQDNPDRQQQMMNAPEQAWALPFFIATVLPTGLKGILIAGLLAAGISSLNGALVALAQTTERWLSGGILAGSPENGKSTVHLSRFYTLFWGIGLALAAIAFKKTTENTDALNMALRLTSFTYGALIGSLLLAFLLKNRNDRGVVFGAAYAVLTVFGTIWHEAWAHNVLIGGVVLLLIWWWYALFEEVEQLPRIKDQDSFVRHAWYVLLAEYPRTVWVLAASALALFTHWAELTGIAEPEGQFELAWPWYLPGGVGITLVLGYLLSRTTDNEGRKRSIEVKG